MTDYWTGKRANGWGKTLEWSVRRWTPEEDAILREMADKGATGAAIGLKLGRQRSAVMGRFQRLGIKLGDMNGYNVCRRATDAVASFARPKRPRILLFKKPGEKVRLKREYKPVPIPFKDVEPAAIIDPNCKCTIENLPDKGCRWPLWNDNSTEKFYCGTPTSGSSYCLGHALIATTTKGYALYASRDPLLSLDTKTLPANSPKSTVA